MIPSIAVMVSVERLQRGLRLCQVLRWAMTCSICHLILLMARL